MTARGDVVITGVGARIATGLDALGAATSLRARKSFVAETRLVDRAGEPIALATVASIPEDLLGRDRFPLLAAPALAECARAWGTRPPLPLLLAVPVESDPFDARGTRLLAAIGEQARVRLDPVRSKVVPHGRAGGAIAIEQALARLKRGEDEAILVGGVDSWLDPDRLDVLDRARRLHGPATENGFVPGEGAAFVLLTGRSRAGTDPRHASIVGFGNEREPRPYGSREPTHALGLTLAAKRALESAGPGAKVDWTLTDVVGERHRVEEWMFASARFQSTFTEDVRQDTPLLLSGDVGAAAVPLLAVLACMGWKIGASPPGLALITASSDEAERGAILLAAEGPS